MSSVLQMVVKYLYKFNNHAAALNKTGDEVCGSPTRTQVYFPISTILYNSVSWISIIHKLL